MAIATAPAPAPETLFRPQSREKAEDRWEGLMLDRANPNVPSALSDRLCAILVELAGGMGRESPEMAVDDLLEAIREWLVIWVETGGVPPTESGEPFAFVKETAVA